MEGYNIFRSFYSKATITTSFGYSDERMSSGRIVCKFARQLDDADHAVVVVDDDEGVPSSPAA